MDHDDGDEMRSRWKDVLSEITTYQNFIQMHEILFFNVFLWGGICVSV